MTEPLIEYIIALGANLGDPEPQIDEAIQRLAEATNVSLESIERASLFRTTPVDCPAGTPDFINTVIVFESNLDPHQMLALTQAIEVELGRPSDHGHNEPRTVDLDIIAAGDLTIRNDNLIIPHPRARERNFVLQPLAELRPELVLPNETETVQQLAKRIVESSSDREK